MKNNTKTDILEKWGPRRINVRPELAPLVNRAVAEGLMIPGRIKGGRSPFYGKTSPRQLRRCRTFAEAKPKVRRYERKAAKREARSYMAGGINDA